MKAKAYLLKKTRGGTSLNKTKVNHFCVSTSKYFENVHIESRNRLNYSAQNNMPCKNSSHLSSLS